LALIVFSKKENYQQLMQQVGLAERCSFAFFKSTKPKFMVEMPPGAPNEKILAKYLKHHFLLS